jgi:glyoxylase-like metal-dependent hydrolase (beta-lactamase superfamily II)
MNMVRSIFKIRKVTVGPLETNCYILVNENTNNAVVVDPGWDSSKIIKALRDAHIKYIIATHGHFDHVSAIKNLKETKGGLFIIHKLDLEMLSYARVSSYFLLGVNIDEPPTPDMIIDNEPEIEFEDLKLKIIHIPGHSPGSIGIYIKEINTLLSGDTIFMDSIGRTDIPGGSDEELRNSLRRLFQILPDTTIIYPGHGPETTLGREKNINPFINDILFGNY